MHELVQKIDMHEIVQNNELTLQVSVSKYNKMQQNLMMHILCNPAYYHSFLHSYQRKNLALYITLYIIYESKVELLTEYHTLK